MTSRFAITLVVAAIVGGVSRVEAATVSSVSGELLVNQGAGYKAMSGAATLAAGSLVMVGAGGSAQIAYEDGCIIDVTPGKVELVGVQSPCAAGAASAMTTGATPPVPAGGPPAGGLGAISSTYMLAGAGIAAGVAGAVVISNAQRAEQRQRNAASP